MPGEGRGVRTWRMAVAAMAGTAAAVAAVLGTVMTLSASADAFRRVGVYGEPGIVVTGAAMLLGASVILIALVGTLITMRLPGHPLGWLLLGLSALSSIGSLTQGYSLAAYGVDGALPGGALAAWANNHVWGPAIAILAIAILLFPSGRPVSRAWGRAFAVMLAISLGIMTVGAFAPGPMPLALGVPNPFGVAALAPIPREVLNLGVLLVVFLTAFAAASLVVRYRRAIPLERLQLKWVAAATVVVAVVFALLAFVRPWDEVSDLLFWASLTSFPLAFGIAILRYRLYAIDLIIRRTLVYGALTAMLGAGYVAGVIVFQAMLGSVTGGDALAVAAATLVVAGAFGPLRRRLQDVIDRRFYRVRYDAERATAGLAERIGREVDLQVIEADLVDAVVDAVHPRHVGMWRRSTAPAAADVGRRR